MNKHILLVMKWLNDNTSVTQDELEANKESADAYAAAYAYVTEATYNAATYDAADEYWVNRYFELSGENKQDYLDALNAETKPICTKLTDSTICFDLMFRGCQTINTTQAVEILEAIKAGKIKGVSYNE